MVIDKILVSYDTFKMLYDAYNEYAQKKQTIVFENSIYEIMQTLSVSIQLSKLSSFDMMALYEMGMEVHPTMIAFNKLPNPNELEGSLKEARRALPHGLAVKTHIYNGTEKEKHLADGIVPLACASHNAVVTFTGQTLYTLTSITGNLLMDDIFRDANGFFTECPSEEYLENYFGGKFTSAFFTTILNLTKDIDVRKEYFMENNYYRFAHKNKINSVVLCTAMTEIHGGINFLNVNPDDFAANLKRIQEEVEKDDKYDKYQNTFTFVCHSTLQVFLLLRMSGYGTILHHDDFKIVYGKNNLFIPSDIQESIHNEVRDFINEMQEFRDAIDKKTMPDLSKFQFMYHGNPIRYLFRVSMKDLIEIQNSTRETKFNEGFADFIESMLGYMHVVANNISSEK